MAISEQDNADALSRSGIDPETGGWMADDDPGRPKILWRDTFSRGFESGINSIHTVGTREEHIAAAIYGEETAEEREVFERGWDAGFAADDELTVESLKQAGIDVTEEEFEEEAKEGDGVVEDHPPNAGHGMSVEVGDGNRSKRRTIARPSQKPRLCCG